MTSINYEMHAEEIIIQRILKTNEITGMSIDIENFDFIEEDVIEESDNKSFNSYLNSNTDY